MKLLNSIDAKNAFRALRLTALLFVVQLSQTPPAAAQQKALPTPDLSSAVQEAARGTKLDAAIREAGNLRDGTATQQLVAKYIEEAKKKKNRHSGAPVIQPQWIAQGRDPLEMREVAGDQRQIVPQGNRRYHGVRAADRLTRTFQVSEIRPASSAPRVSKFSTAIVGSSATNFWTRSSWPFLRKPLTISITVIVEMA